MVALTQSHRTNTDCITNVSRWPRQARDLDTWGLSGISSNHVALGWHPLASITAPDPRSSHSLPALGSDLPACQLSRVNLHLLLSQMPGSHIGLLIRNLPLLSPDTASPALKLVLMLGTSFSISHLLFSLCLFSEACQNTLTFHSTVVKYQSGCLFHLRVTQLCDLSFCIWKMGQ